MFKYKEREETDAIRLYKAPSYHDMDYTEILTRMKQGGRLNLGFHFILRPDGLLEEGIPINNYADIDLKGYETAIYILYTGAVLTDCAAKVLNNLAEDLKLPLIKE